MPETSNGDTRRDLEKNTQDEEVRYRGVFWALIEDFSPLWFTWCMNSGIIAILLHQLPYQFRGIGILSTIAFLFDFVLFIIASILMLLRLLVFKKRAFDELTGDISTLALLACWPIAWLTLVAFVALTVSEAYWGGYPFTVVAYVMWWFGACWMLATLLFVFTTLITRHETSDRQVPPFVIIPAVGVSTLATVGGLLSIYAVELGPRLAVPLIITSFYGVGIGILLAIFLYTFLFHQLLAKGWPEPQQTVLMFLFIGPTGQSAAALQLLGSSANTYHRFADYNRGTFLTAQGASALDGSCILVSLLLAGLGLIWILFSFIAMGYRAVRKELKWTPAWNSIIFPTGTYATSTLIFSIEMDSPFFRVITTIILVFLVLVFFLNLGFTVWEISHGRLLIVKENPRMKDQLNGKEKSK